MTPEERIGLVAAASPEPAPGTYVHIREVERARRAGAEEALQGMVEWCQGAESELTSDDDVDWDLNEMNEVGEAQLEMLKAAGAEADRRLAALKKDKTDG